MYAIEGGDFGPTRRQCATMITRPCDRIGGFRPSRLQITVAGAAVRNASVPDKHGPLARRREQTDLPTI